MEMKKLEPRETDIYGVRFPFREELNVTDDEPFRTRARNLSSSSQRSRAENANLMGLGTNIGKDNIQYVLRAIGAFEPDSREGLPLLFTKATCMKISNEKSLYSP
jgi:hypothetical protein